MTKVITKEEFENADAYNKGYAVYMVGAREDQPNVPATYTPTPGENAAYDRGQFDAYIEVLDSEG